MWDVIWTDPDRELVGERRARKEQKRSSRSETSSKDGPITSSRNSFSTRSSVSSSDAALSFLRTQKELNNGKAKSKNVTDVAVAEGKNSWRSTSWSKASSTASSALASLSIPSTRSPLSPTFDIRSRRSSGLATTNESSLHSRPSIASRTTEDNEATVAVDEQPLDQGCDESATAVTTTSVHKERGSASEKGRSKALLDDSVFERRGEAQSQRQASNENAAQTTAVAVIAEPESTPLAAITQDLMLEIVNSASAHASDNAPPAVPPKSPLRPTSRSCSLIAIPTNPKGWLSVDEWSRRTPSQKTDPEEDVQHESKMLDMSVLEEELTQMFTAAPEDMLSKLRGFPEEGQKAHQELERKRWLLCELEHLDRNSSRLSLDHDSGEATRNAQEALILFESSNTTAYFAAQYPERNIYHVARLPLRNATFANVIPLSLPSLSVDILAHALPPDLDLIYSLSLPSLCPAPDLTRTLTCLRSHLKHNGGTLHLTLIDAFPHPATLGPVLRNWLERRLIANMSSHSLSHTPTRLFPKCLAAASLRGQGSRRVKTKFFASSASIRCERSKEEQQHEDHDPDPAIRKLRAELRTKAELRCLVGRMLWTEVWGPYVAPCKEDKGSNNEQALKDSDKHKVSWWWEDEACMAECVQLGTFWEYHIIDAVRGA